MFTNRDLAEMLIHLISGGVAGAVSTAMTYPLSNIRYRCITNESNGSENFESRSQNKSKFISFLEKFDTFKTLRELYLNNRLASTYDGMSSSVMGSVVTNGFYFCSYNFWDKILEFLDMKHNVARDAILTSLLAAICTALVSNPIWVLNSRMTKSKDQIGDISNYQMIVKIYHEEGIEAFFKGILPSLFLTLNPVIQFSIYEILKDSFAKSPSGLTTKHIAFISFISKFVTTVVTYPLMTIKTIFQANDVKSTEVVLHYLYELLKNDGIKGYYRGFSAKIIQTMINNVILMLTYEKIQNIVRFLLLNFLFRQKSK